MAVSAASAMSLKRSFSGLDLAADARAARARRSALRRRAQPSNKEGLEDPTLETPLKDTGIPHSPPAPPIDGRTLFDLEVEEEDNEIARRSIVERLFPNVSWDTIDEDARANLYDHALDSGLVPQRRRGRSPIRPRPILNDLGPVALPRIGKKERKEAHRERAVALEALPPGKGGPAPVALPMPCPRHSQDGIGWWRTCQSTCELCFPTPLRPAACRYANFRDDASDCSGDRAASEDPLLPQTPWPCARCNLEPVNTIWRPLDSATAFDTKERICSACWLAEEVESSSDTDTEDSVDVIF